MYKMEKEKTTQTDYDRPVAYDTNGRPLYARPQSSGSSAASVVHVTRPTKPEKPVISEEIRLKHERSKQMFPDLNLSEGEYVITVVRRHPIGLFVPFTLGIFLISLSFTVLFNYSFVAKSIGISNSVDPTLVISFILLFIFFVIIGTCIAYYVYTSNRFVLTNESVIQDIKTAIFNEQEQTISLADIEDASYTQNGIIQQLFDYGVIRLSTEGEETTYYFPYVSRPRQHIAVINNAIEAFKNGCPVDEGSD
jgi:hypothetical protein